MDIVFLPIFLIFAGNMLRLTRLLPHQSDAGIKLVGLALAATSTIFAFVMMTSPPSTPRIHGMEHLSIFARPANRSWERKTGGAPTLDFSPIGSLHKGNNSSLSGFEILQATTEDAILRTPEGRVAHVARGSRIARLGAIIAIERRGRSWVIKTEAGEIR